MALTLMFFEAHSFASAFVMPATPCLAAVYAGIVHPPWKLDSEAMFTIFPPPCLTITRPASWHSSKTPVSIRLRIVSHFSIEKSSERSRC